MTALLSLPEDARGAFKGALGPILTDVDAVLERAGRPLVTIGDVVTYHVQSAGVTPDVAVVDGLTKREPVEGDVASVTETNVRRVDVENPAGVLTEAMLTVLVEAIAAPDPVVIIVDGEEDLVTVPAVLATPVGGTVLYGMPDEGMVVVDVTGDAKARVDALLSRFEGDVERARSIL